MNAVKLNQYRVTFEDGTYVKVDAPTLQLAIDYLETTGYDKLEKKGHAVSQITMNDKAVSGYVETDNALLLFGALAVAPSRERELKQECLHLQYEITASLLHGSVN